MAEAERKSLIKRLEKQLDARVLVLITGDRQGMETKIAPDLLPLVSEHVSRLGVGERLALFLYTPGGDSIAGWGLVNLLREYSKHLLTVIPFRALSCGTLIALGSDVIVMGRHGLLSPVDPSVASPFNPLAPGSDLESGRLQFLPVSVEDMIGFLNLARDEAKLVSEASLVEILKVLAEKVHPLALGAVYRAREQSSDLAKRLLRKHMTGEDDDEKITRIVNRLSRELPSHSYLIGRTEATTDIKLQVMTDVSDELEALIWDLYKEYEGWLQLTIPWSADLDLGDQTSKRARQDRAVIESLVNGKLYRHVFLSDMQLIRITPSDGPEQIMQRILYQGWAEMSEGS